MDKDSKNNVAASQKSNVDDKGYKKVQFLPVHIGAISTLEEMDVKVLQFQNKKLAQRLEERKRIESEYKQRIEQLEKRQTQDDAVLNVVNRYWNQLNEDIRILLQRFNAETTDESENLNECEATTSFLMLLSTWDKEELDEKLANRVQVSKRAVAKIIQAFDRLVQRCEKIAVSLKEKKDDGDVEMESEGQQSLEECIKENYVEIQKENKRLHELNTSLHEKYHAMSLKIHELQDALNARETETAELRNRLDDMEYERLKLQSRNNKLEHYLAESVEKMKEYEQLYGSVKPTTTADTTQTATVAPPTSIANIDHKKIEELQQELEAQRELANNRLQELEETSLKLRETLKEVEQLRTDIRQLPESVIVETTEYKCLQSQFSVLYNESMQMRTQLEDCHMQLQNTRNAHLRQIEIMESEELVMQKKLRNTILEIEDKYSQLLQEYEHLKIEYEQTLVANDQSGPINREMRHLITSLQNHNGQLKNETHRYKRKYKESMAEYARFKKELDELKTKSNASRGDVTFDIKYAIGLEDSKSTDSCGVDLKDDISTTTVAKKDVPQESNSNLADNKDVGSPSAEKSGKKDPTAVAPSGGGSPHSVESISNNSTTNPALSEHPNVVVRKEDIPPVVTKDPKIYSDKEIIKDLKNQVRRCKYEYKELQLIYSMRSKANSETRDKAQLMVSEHKLKAEVAELKNNLRKVIECKKEYHKKMSDDETTRRLRFLEDQVYHLQKVNQLHKQEEEASLCEMEVTGQAYEDAQEQNSRLIQQLKEKDDANFKLMTERIKSNQMYKLSKEEKESLQETVSLLSTQVESINIVVRKLEEKERALQNCMGNMEKELNVTRQAMEMHKRKAIESAQSAADLKMHLDKYHAQMKEAQQVVTEKTSALESEAYKTNRLQEEIGQLKRKVERMKKIEAAETLDAVLMEEIKEYKETLTCPSCKVQRKDAVLIKCFHVFCWDCLRTRYETRQRKCPKCNAAFGANDYHRLYLSN